MDYSKEIDFIRDDRLDLVEQLAEERERVLETLCYVAGTSATVQHWLPVLESYCQLRRRIISLVANMDAVEEQLLSAMSSE